ncbi:hypothetical protein LTR86_003676 [Recurvomyces mirabilis]|nr:hypothetical protein LTR86_003676 [Recurvomyces mirabilis]
MSTISSITAAKQGTHTPHGPPLPQLRKHGARLLALDGGGVKGVSSALILDEIMTRVKRIELQNSISISQADRKPVDYFDIAAGTSTGGLICLMLFRLRMSVPSCRDCYHSLAKHIFAPRFMNSEMLGKIFGKLGLMLNIILKSAEFAAKPLEDAIRDVVGKYSRAGDPDQDYLVHPESGIMFMCATLKDKGECVLMRSYIQPSDAVPYSSVVKQASAGGGDDTPINNIPIVTAARATSAAPVYLPEERWVPARGADAINFWDGGVLNNNPIEQLWGARYDLVDVKSPPPPVSVVLSLGCGWAVPAKPHFLFRIFGIMTTFSQSYMANTEAKHRDFWRLTERMKERGDQNNDIRYFRFNVPTGGQKFNMADPKIIEPLEKLTRDYMARPEISRELDEVAALLASRD